MSDKRLLVIDGLQNFLRHFVVNPSLSDNGSPVGGVVGFIKDLNKFCREFKPDLMVVCWDGAGGSTKRKQLVKSYKEGRKPLRLNRSDNALSEHDNLENKTWQQLRLIEYLNSFPMIQLMFDGVEADDLVAHVAKMPRFKSWLKTIISSDKDFTQLCDDTTILYRPVQKHFLNVPRIVEEFHIHPTNFAMARAIAGDSSDNLPGVGGVGLPTVAKRIPEFESDDDMTFERLFKICEERKDKCKAYQSILENKDTIKLNYKMMQLYAPSIPLHDKEKVEQIFSSFKPAFNKMDFTKLAYSDGLGTLNLDSMFQTFNSMAFNARSFSL